MKFTIFKRMISGYAVIMVIFMGIYVTLKLNQMMEINHKIAKADGGTFFLDEISEMPLTMQAKFLRVLGDMAFYPFGGQRMVQVNVRMIAASNKNLEEVVKSGRFREDLFYRIHVIHIPIPPLRERKEDIPLLARHFLRKYA